MTYILIEKNYDSKNKCFIESSTKITKGNDLKLLAKMMYCHVYGYDFQNICYWCDIRSMERIEAAINNYIKI